MLVELNCTECKHWITRAALAILQAAPEGLVGGSNVHETADEGTGYEILRGEELEDLQEQLRRDVAEYARIDLRLHVSHSFPFPLPSPHPLVLLLLVAASAAISVKQRILLPLILVSIIFQPLLLLLALPLLQPISNHIQIRIRQSRERSIESTYIERVLRAGSGEDLGFKEAGEAVNVVVLFVLGFTPISLLPT